MLATVYFQESNDLNTEQILKKMKGQFNRENWKLFGIYIDKVGRNDALLEIVDTVINKVDVLYVYSLDKITDEFNRKLLVEASRNDNVLIREYDLNTN